MAGPDREHLLALKVMRLTKPAIGHNNSVYLDGREANASEDPFCLTNKFDANVFQATPYERNSPVLLLPQNFGNIFLGETFSCYISIHNPSQSACRGVSLKVEMQTQTTRINLPPGKSSGTIAEIPPGQSFDDIIHYEIKELNTHILVCTVNYTTPYNTRSELRKFFKFQVLKPLELKTKFLDTEGGDIFLEAQMQNITPGGVFLEKVDLDPLQPFTCENLSQVDDSDPFERYLNPLDVYQFLFRISPSPEVRENPKALKEATAVGRLDIQWRSSMGEKGRLQTSPLRKLVPGSGDVSLIVKSMKSQVDLEYPVDIECQLINSSGRAMDLRVELLNNPSYGILWQGLSGRELGSLKPNQSILLNFTFLPIKMGLQTVSGIRIYDLVQKRSHEYDGLAHLYVK